MLFSICFALFLTKLYKFHLSTLCNNGKFFSFFFWCYILSLLPVVVHLLYSFTCFWWYWCLCRTILGMDCHCTLTKNEQQHCTFYSSHTHIYVAHTFRLVAELNRYHTKVSSWVSFYHTLISFVYSIRSIIIILFVYFATKKNKLFERKKKITQMHALHNLLLFIACTTESIQK